MEAAKFLLSPEEDRSVDPETQARLEALLQAAGKDEILFCLTVFVVHLSLVPMKKINQSLHLRNNSSQGLGGFCTKVCKQSEEPVNFVLENRNMLMLFIWNTFMVVIKKWIDDQFLCHVDYSELW